MRCQEFNGLQTSKASKKQLCNRTLWRGMVDVMRSNMLLSSSVLHWLQRQSSLWPLALGSVLGLGIGAGALWGIGGLIGAAVCLVVLGTACWYARDAEPVLVGVDMASTPQEASSATALEPAPEPEPPTGRTPRDGRIARRNLLDGLARY